jgi:hypothetical protein
MQVMEVMSRPEILNRHCEKRSDEAIQNHRQRIDGPLDRRVGFASSR